MKEFLRQPWDWLAKKKNRDHVATIAVVAAPIIALSGIICNNSLLPPPPVDGVRLSVKGKLDIRDPTVDESEVSIGLLWGIEDDRMYYWTESCWVLSFRSRLL